MEISIFHAISLGIVLLSSGFSAAMFCVIKFNDLHHLAISLNELKTDVKENTKTLGKLEKTFSGFEATCKERHKK